MAGNQGKNSAKNGLLGGRPLKESTIAAQIFRDALAKQIRDEKDEWIIAIKDSAMGHRFQDEKGNVYTKSPDPNAWQKATDRAFGKPEQAVDLTSLGKQLSNVNVQFLATNNDPAAGEDEASV